MQNSKEWTISLGSSYLVWQFPPRVDVRWFMGFWTVKCPLHHTKSPHVTHETALHSHLAWTWGDFVSPPLHKVASRNMQDNFGIFSLCPCEVTLGVYIRAISPEVKNRGTRGPTKRTYILQKFFFKISVRSVCLCIYLCVYLSVCSGYNFWNVKATNFHFQYTDTFWPISSSSFEYQCHWVKVNFKWKTDIFYLTVTSVCLYYTKTYLKVQGHLKVKV